MLGVGTHLTCLRNVQNVQYEYRETKKTIVVWIKRKRWTCDGEPSRALMVRARSLDCILCEMKSYRKLFHRWIMWSDSCKEKAYVCKLHILWTESWSKGNRYSTQVDMYMKLQKNWVRTKRFGELPTCKCYLK